MGIEVLMVKEDGVAAQYPRKIERLIAELCKLPGIGRKSAQQLAFHILSLDIIDFDFRSTFRF